MQAHIQWRIPSQQKQARNVNREINWCLKEGREPLIPIVFQFHKQFEEPCSQSLNTWPPCHPCIVRLPLTISGLGLLRQSFTQRQRQRFTQRQRHMPISYLISSEIWKLLWPLGLLQVRGTVCTRRANADCCFSKCMLYLSVVWQVVNRNISPPLHCVLGSIFPTLSIMCAGRQSQTFHFGEEGSQLYTHNFPASYLSIHTSFPWHTDGIVPRNVW